LDAAIQTVLSVARGVLAELDLDVVLDRVLESALQLTQARYAALGVLDEDKPELARFLTRGVDRATEVTIGPQPRGRGVLGVLIAEPAPLRLADVGQHPRSYGFPHGHPPMRTFLGVPIMVGDTPFGNLYLTEKARGAEFSEADEQALMVLAELAGVAIDNARRYTGAQEKRDEMERTVATLEATTQIARAVGGETDIDVILELVAKRGRALVSAQALLIELRQSDELLVAAGAGELPTGIVGTRVPAAAETVASHAMRMRSTVRLEDDLDRARFDEHGLGRYGVRADGGLVVPLVFRGQANGVLVAVNRLHDGPAFTTRDERLLEAFAASAATAVATARSFAVERQRQRVDAAEAERKRWARELHDETLQHLSELRIELSRAARSERPQALQRTVEQAIGTLEHGIADLRTLITDLRPATLDELGTQAAVEALAERTARHGLQVDVSVDLAYERGRASTRLVAELEIALYRIVQEALTNAVKHGKARHAVVEIYEDPTAVYLSVCDDGEGFDPHARGNGFGLLGMRERAELLGGQLSLDAAPEGGVLLKACLPVFRRADESGSWPSTARLAGPAHLGSSDRGSSDRGSSGRAGPGRRHPGVPAGGCVGPTSPATSQAARASIAGGSRPS
jgi:signal transduction histidine kinase